MVILSGPGPINRAKGASVMTTIAPAVPTAWYWNRWYQLVLGLIAMMTISSPQYVWTLFTGPLNQKLGTTLAELQWTFSLLIILQTWCSPLQAYLVDKFGPRLLISVGALMSGGGWVLSSYVDNIWALYFSYGVICGFGTGIIYVGIIGLMVRWFPDRRGLATGLAAAGYGFGAIFTSFPIDSMIKTAGYAHTLVVWGIIQGSHRYRRRAMVADTTGRLATGWLYTRVRYHDAVEAQLHTGANVENPDLLAAVPDDEHDVDQRPYGRLQRRTIREGI